jgi:uncharacterized protein (TIGR02453 family)
VFSKEALQFLRGLKKNNNRDWFKARKDTYDEHVKAPMLALIDEINKALVKLEPGFITEPKKAMFRIYRDTRFSHDKTPYKTNASALFSRKQLDKLGGGVLYISVSPKEVMIGSGSYMPGPRELLMIRQHLAENHKQFRKILGKRELRGEELQRPPKGFTADHPAIDLIRKKQWLLHVTLPAEAALQEDFATEVIRQIRLMIPFVGFLNAPMLAKAGKARDLLIDAPGREW